MTQTTRNKLITEPTTHVPVTRLTNNGIITQNPAIKINITNTDKNGISPSRCKWTVDFSGNPPSGPRSSSANCRHLFSEAIQYSSVGFKSPVCRAIDTSSGVNGALSACPLRMRTKFGFFSSMHPQLKPKRPIFQIVQANDAC